MTPPARLAFSTSSMLNFPFLVRTEVRMAKMALPQRERKVFRMALCYPLGEARMALKLGQYIQRKRVPIMAKRLE